MDNFTELDNQELTSIYGGGEGDFARLIGRAAVWVTICGSPVYSTAYTIYRYLN